MLVGARILLLCVLRLSCLKGEESSPDSTDVNGGQNFTTLAARPRAAITSQANGFSSPEMQPTPSASSISPEPFCDTFSCRGRCGKKFLFFEKVPCSCDKDCPIFHDCCKDFIPVCKNGTDGLLPGDAPGANIASSISCAHYPAYTPIPAYMVTKCPGGYKNQTVKELCEENPQNLLMLHLPVTEDGSDYVYRNLYCAVCHSVDTRKLRHFYIRYSCVSNDTQFEEYIKNKSFAEITLHDTKEGCSLNLLETRAVRLCVDAHLDGCGEPAAINDACAAYLDPVTVSFTQPSGAVQTVTARNIDCLHCNNLTEFLLSSKCWTKPQRAPSVPKRLEFSISFNTIGEDIPDEPIVQRRPAYNNNGRIEGIAYISPKEEDDDIFLTFLFTNANKEENKPMDVLANLSKIVDLRDVKLTECLQLGSSIASTDRRNLITAYQINTTLTYDILQIFRLIELLRTFSAEKAGGRNISGILRNTRKPIEDVCLSPTRYYQEKEFYERLKSKAIKSNVPLQLEFPVEIFWARSKVHGSFSNCPDFTKFTFTEDISFPIFKVCGDTLEQNCQVTKYDVKDVSKAAVYNSPVRPTETFLYQTESVIATCGEIFTELSMVVFYITVIGCSLSAMVLLLTIWTFWVFEQLRNSSGMSDLQFICALFMDQCLFGVGVVVAWRNAYVCQAVAVLKHFFQLGTFSCTNIMAFDLACTFSGTSTIPTDHKGRRRRVQYMLVAWGLPLIVVTVSVTLNYTAAVSVLYGERGFCWIPDKYALLAFFVAPVTLHVLFNVGSFSCSVYKIRKKSKVADDMQKLSERRSKMGACARITAIMGVTCLIGYFTTLWPLPALRILFAVVKSFQGVFISMNFILTSRVIKLYKGRLFRQSFTGKEASRDSTSRGKLRTGADEKTLE